MIICEFALLLFASLHIASSSSYQWYNAIEFWSNVVCSMKDIKTMNFHGILESSISKRNAIFLEQYFQAFIYDVTRKCETTILSRIYTPPDSENLFVNNNDIAYRVVKRPSIWKIISGDALPSRVMPSNNVARKIRKIRSDKTFDGTWNMHIILIRDVHFFDQISKDGTTFKWNSHDRFIVLFARFPEEHRLSNKLNSRIDDILKTLWFKHKVHKVFVSEVILINDTIRIDRTVRTYNPFTKVNNSVWGRVEIINVITAEEASKMLLYLTYRRTKNMNGYVLKVGYFKKKEKSIIEPIKSQSITRYSYGDVFKEFDEKMLNTIAQDMNFQIEYVHPADNKWFGSQLFNGTYVGAIGDIVYGRTDICFISFFVKKYSINPKEDVDFSSYVDFDRICMVVPKATKIPKGIRIYHFFPLSIWICLMLTHIFTYLIWYFLQVFTPKRMIKRNLRATIYRSFLLNAGCPQKLPNTNAERILLSGVFLVNITLVGIFNGILYNSFAYDMYYPDIDSLHDLDVSGLPISLSSASLADLFDNDDNDVDSSLMRNLQKKIQFNENGIISTAHYRNTSAFARESYFPVISEELADADGGPLLHLVKECPGKFYLSYLLPKNSIFNEKINTLINHLNQAGLPTLWYQYIVNAFDVHKKLLSKEILARNKKKMGSFVPFNLADMQSSFYMLLIGLLISTIVFFHEKNWLKVPLLHIEKPNDKSTCINH